MFEYEQLQKVRFDIIRYANCWEDADILLEGLNPKNGSNFLSVGSGGDNSFSLLSTSPNCVIAIDISLVQLYLIELKKAAFKQFPYPTLLAFLGFNDCGDREQLFYQIKPELSSNARIYWENHIKQIRRGVIYYGKFEKFFLFIKRFIIPFLNSKKKINKLFESKSENEQIEFYDKEWNNWRWRLIFKLFFNKYILGKYARDPEFLKNVKLPVAEYIFMKAENHIRSVHAQQNYFLKFILTGNFDGSRNTFSEGESILPHYVREENFGIIKANINKLEIKYGSAEEVLAKTKDQFNYINFSNIFEYMSYPIFRSTVENIMNEIKAGTIISYWNLMVPRRFSDLYPERFMYLKELSEQLSAKDKGFFYNQFIVEQSK